MQDDDRIDDAVRRASARLVDEDRLTNAVLTRIRQDRRHTPSPWAGLFALPDFTGPGRLAPAGFAMVLLATPFAVATYPGDAADSAIYALALGDPGLLAVTEPPFAGMGLFE